MFKLFKKKKKIIALLMLIGFFTSVFIFPKKKNYQENITDEFTYDVCDLAKLDFSSSFENKNPRPKCDIEQNWGNIDPIEHKWMLNHNVTLKIDSIDCKKRRINRIDDFKIDFGSYTKLENGDLIKDEVFEVECQGTNKENKNLVKFKNVFVQIVSNEFEKQSNHTTQNINGCHPYNVMLLSYDSVSQVSFMNRLKKTVNLIKNTENFHILNGYNIVGDGTPAALIPIYTGFTEAELPSGLKNDPNGKYVDEVYPFIWKDLHKKNYTSIYLEDWPRSGVGAFTYRMRGFLNHTTKHYLKQYHIYLKNNRKKNDDFCNGDTTRHKITLDLLTNFKKIYKNIKSNIAIMHFIENSHDTNDNLHWLDDEIYEFLSDGFKNQIFDDTIIFLYSDHGLRYKKYQYKERSQRFLEERLPFFSVYLPDSFVSNNKNKMFNFQSNYGKLISPFDVHATVRDLTCLKRESKNDRHRSISLFEKISKYRNCDDIGIAEHFCTCVKDWKLQNINTKETKDVADFFVGALNSITSSKRDLCQVLSLKMIISSEKLEMKEKILYRISIKTSPNNGIYETIVYKGLKKGYEFIAENFSIKSKNDISRIDAYGGQPWCVSQFGSNPGLLIDLRKFCLCFPKKS